MVKFPPKWATGQEIDVWPIFYIVETGKRFGSLERCIQHCPQGYCQELDLLIKKIQENLADLLLVFYIAKKNDCISDSHTKLY